MKASPARKAIQKAVTAMIMSRQTAFFGTLALRLKLVEDPSCRTAWTDGVRMGYNPDFILSLSHDERVTLVAHEVMHCANGHPWRRDNRDPKRWNEATDYVINSCLKAAGFALPKRGLLSDHWTHEHSAEWVYDRIPVPPPQQKPGSGKPGQGTGTEDAQNGSESDDNPFGEVRDAPSADGDSEAATEADWRIAVQQSARAAKMAGDLPAGIGRLVEDTGRTRVDWRSILHRFIQEVTRSDYSWTRPNSRYFAHGLYYPSLYQKELGPVLVAVDTSGSIDQTLLSKFGKELRAVFSEAKPVRTHVMYCDTKVHRMETFEQADTVELSAVGGGGTRFDPVFDKMEELEDKPVAVIYLTDLYVVSFPEPPNVPVLWATTTRNREVPFGEIVYLD